MTAYTNRHNAKRDENEKPLVDLLRRSGFRVERLHKPVDLLLGYRGHTRIAEVKMPKGAFTLEQMNLIDHWPGGKVWVLRNDEDVKAMIKGWPDGKQEETAT